VPSTHSTPPRAIPDYELLTWIGRGSYGEVWLARSATGAYRAVKIVDRAAFDSAQPFEREFEGVRRYEPVSRTQENLVAVLHTGRNDDAGLFYYAMEIADDALRGRDFEAANYTPRTLAGEIANRKRLPIEEVVYLGTSLARALGHLHEHGLVHRDVKPSNVVFVARVPKLADIGLVSATDSSRSFVGTEGFVPREGPGSPQADLYGLGKLLYEAATGLDRHEFPSLPADCRHWPDHPALLELNEVLLRACDEESTRRYANAGEMLADLALIAGGKSVRRLRLMETRFAWMLRASALTGVVAAIALGAWWLAQREARVQTTLRKRAEKAEKTAREELLGARLARARAERLSGQPGQRQNSLAAIAEAAAIQPSDALRTEAITALALSDLVEEHRWPVLPRDPWPRPRACMGYYADHFAVATREGKITFHQIVDGRELGRLPYFGQQLFSLSPDGTRLVMASNDGDLCVWDVDRPTPCLKIPSLKPKSEWVLDWTADGGHLAIWQRDAGVLLYDLAGGEPRCLIKPNPLEDEAFLRLSPDDRWLALVPENAPAVRIFDAHTGAFVRQWTLDDLDDKLWNVAWSPDGNRLAGGTLGGAVQIWTMNAPAAEPVRLRHRSAVVMLAWHPNGQFLATSSWDSTTRLWDTHGGRLLLTIPRSGDRLAFTADGRHFALIDTSDGESLVSFRCETPRVATIITSGSRGAFSPDGTLMAVINIDKDGVAVFDVTSGAYLTQLSIRGLKDIKFAVDGKALWCAGAAGLSYVPLSRDEKGIATFGPPEIRQQGYFFAVEVAPGMLAATRGRGRPRLFLEDHEHPLPGTRAGNLTLAFSPDASRLAVTGYLQNDIELWDVASLHLDRVLYTENDCFPAFSPDGRHLAAADRKCIRVWDAETGAVVWEVPRHLTGGVRGCVAWSPNSRILAAATTYYDIALLDAATGRQIVTLSHPVHESIGSLAFDPSGNYLLSGYAHCWNLRALHEELKKLGLDFQQP
jgi:WD40 repeat protein